MKVLFDDHSLHFAERCFKYERYDAGMQLGLVFEYGKWITRMVKDATRKESHGRRIFFEGLCEAFSEDWDEVLEETNLLDRGSGDRQRLQISRGLGIPLNQENWMLEDKRRFAKYGEGVHGWPQPLNIRQEVEELDREQEANTSGSEGTQTSQPDAAIGPPGNKPPRLRQSSTLRLPRDGAQPYFRVIAFLLLAILLNELLKRKFQL